MSVGSCFASFWYLRVKPWLGQEGEILLYHRHGESDVQGWGWGDVDVDVELVYTILKDAYGVIGGIMQAL